MTFLMGDVVEARNLDFRIAKPILMLADGNDMTLISGKTLRCSIVMGSCDSLNIIMVFRRDSTRIQGKILNWKFKLTKPVGKYQATIAILSANPGLIFEAALWNTCAKKSTLRLNIYLKWFSFLVTCEGRSRSMKFSALCVV